MDASSVTHLLVLRAQIRRAYDQLDAMVCARTGQQELL